MLLVIYILLCIVFGMPWYAYALGVTVWLLTLSASMEA
jgi:hypothetical protein